MRWDNVLKVVITYYLTWCHATTNSCDIRNSSIHASLAKKKNNTKIIVYLSTLIYLVIVIHFSLCLVSFVFALVKLLDKVSHPSLLFSWQKTFHILPNFYIVWSPIYPSCIGFFVIVLWLYTFYYLNAITKSRGIINIFILLGFG